MPAGMRLPRLETKIKYERVIVSGGGTGGHIYPAVAVAEALRRRFGEEVEILFVGAEGKMEMEKVPALGYRIVGLPVAGLQRRFDLKTWRCPSRCSKASARPGAPSRLRGRCGRRFRRVCQRPGAVGGAADGDSDRDSGAELLCGSHQQAAGQACPHDLRVV